MSDGATDDGRGSAFSIGLAVVVVGILVGTVLVGMYVFGLGGHPVATSPQVAFDFERTADGVRIEHAGGEFVGGSEDIEPEDTIAVDGVGESAVVDLVWTGGESRTILDRYDP
ncbi:hypothetical protein BRC79_00940 [Halobacteriales archaeon QH_8_67_27]|nr:MAG: hypothetical protein BRC79_00940 [Halobacteriales archaeon QH_8_67_27]